MSQASRHPRASPVALAVAGLAVLAAVLRVGIIGQSPFADELSTIWIVRDHGFLDVLRTVKSNAEITPPLFFALADLTSQIDFSTATVRLPSLIAGVATVPLVYLLGVRTVGTRAALVAAALVALSPFMIFFSSEARGYALLMALMAGSTLSLLLALEGRRRAWLVVYAICSAGCMYTHYTGAFPLAAQALWALWAHPQARRDVLVANVGAAALFLPWIGGLKADFDSPTTDLLDAISPLSVESVRSGFAHWLYGFPLKEVAGVPGTPALVLMGVGVAVACAGQLLEGRLGSRLRRVGSDRPLLLLIVVALALPVGALATSVVSTDLFSSRNLAASLPATVLLGAALVTRMRSVLWIPATALLLAGFAIGAVRMLDPDNGRPDFEGIAKQIESLPPGTPVIDAGEFTPGPLGSLDVELQGDYPIVRLGIPETDHPFTVFDRPASVEEVAVRASALARDGRLVIVTYPVQKPAGSEREVLRVARVLTTGVLELLRPRFEIVEVRRFRGVLEHRTFLLEER